MYIYIYRNHSPVTSLRSTIVFHHLSSLGHVLGQIVIVIMPNPLNHLCGKEQALVC